MRLTDFLYFSDYFSAYMREKRSIGSPISFRYLTKALGLTSTSSLAMIAVGRRYPTPELLEKLSQKIGWTVEEKRYAELMIAHEKTKSKDDQQIFWEQMNRMRPAHNEEIDLDRLAIIMHWEYLLLICLAGEKGGLERSPEELSRALRFRVSAKEIEEKIRHLESHGFINRDENSKVQRTNKVISTTHEVSSSLIKTLHQQMLKIASEEIYQQDVKDRYFSSMFLTASPKKIDRAKQLLNDFRSEFDKMMTEEDADEPTEVYQLGLQFFKMTQLIPKDL